MGITGRIGAVVFGGMMAASGQAQTGEAVNADRFALERAEAACRDQDFATLLEAITMSEVARAKYSAGLVGVVRGGVVTQVPRAEYQDFPLGMLDYTWVTQASMKAWTPKGGQFDTLEVEMNQSQSNQ